MKLARISLAVGAILIATTACSGGSSDKGASSTPTLQIPTDPGVLDPQTSVGAWGRPMMRMAYDTLVADGPNGTELPQLAESWKVTPTKATFKIRDGITCADGEKFTASTVAANFNRMKDPSAKVPFTASFLGSTDYKVSTDKAKNTVTLELPAPFSPLLSNLGQYPGMICQKGLDNPDQLRTKTFGTGPYTLATSTSGQSYTFKIRNNYSWGPDGATTKTAGMPKTVKIRVVANETTAANLMLSGDLDLGIFTTRGAYERLANSKFTTQKVPGSATYIHFNFLKPANPAQDIGVRRALSETLDRAAMAKIATGSAKQISDSVALPQSSCQSQVSDEGLVQFDVSKAASDLENAGWAKAGDSWTKDGKKLKINLLVTGSAGAGNKPVADYVLGAWSKLGAKVSVEDVDQATGVDRRADGKYDVWIGAWSGVYNPAIISPFLTSPTSANYSYLANKQYNTLAAKAYDIDLSKACEVWGEAQTAINEQVSMVPMYFDATRYVSTKGLSVKTYRSFIESTSLRLK